MSSPPLCGTAEWSAKREVALLLPLERPPPPADARKKSASRGGRQLKAALACAAPAAEPEVQPATAENYAAYALAAAANPRHRPSP